MSAFSSWKEPDVSTMMAAGAKNARELAGFFVYLAKGKIP
jgi:hypothetical protein